MRFAQLIAALILIAVGAVGTFQGYSTLEGSFMTGSPVWMWIGLACVAAGCSSSSSDPSGARVPRAAESARDPSIDLRASPRTEHIVEEEPPALASDGGGAVLRNAYPPRLALGLEGSRG
jgi:hypothetical protein